MTNITKLGSLFNTYAYGRNHAAAFTELLDNFLLPFKVVDTKEEHEARLLRVAAYERKEALMDFLNELGNCSEGFRDPLGEYYMQEISKGHNGQFFTPGHVCDLMAQITIGAAEDGQTILDPACGSGRMLLAAAKINRKLLFFGADIDAVCCKMAVANMLLQSLHGEIAHMDSISNKFFTGYKLGTTLRDGYYHPWYREFTDPHKSHIWLRLPQKVETPFPEQKTVFPTGTASQGTLF